LSWFIAEKSTVNDDSVGATVAGADVVVPPELPELFDELPHAAATSATPRATAMTADRFREICICFPFVTVDAARLVRARQDARHGKETRVNDV
jgi:hypothetical protein